MMLVQSNEECACGAYLGFAIVCHLFDSAVLKKSRSNVFETLNMAEDGLKYDFPWSVVAFLAKLVTRHSSNMAHQSCPSFALSCASNMSEPN